MLQAMEKLLDGDQIVSRPFERVSVEIKTEILMYALTFANCHWPCNWIYVSPGFRTAYQADQSLHPILRLILVCREWRTIVEDTGSFWTNFGVGLDELSISTPDILDLILKRSKGCGLEFYVSQYGFQPDEIASPIAIRLFEMLISESYRWKRVSIDLPFSLRESFIALAKSRDFRRVVSLEIRWDTGMARSDHREPLDLFQDLPVLRKVKIESLFLPKDITTWPQHLTGLHLSGIRDVLDAHSLLNHCSQTIKKLQLFFDLELPASLQKNSHRTSNLDTVTCPHLHSLSCVFSFDPLAIPHYKKLFDSLNFPSLKSLTLERHVWSANMHLPLECFEMFERLFGRSKCHIFDLEVRRIPVDESFIQFFDALGGLCELQIWSWPPSNGILDALLEILEVTFDFGNSEEDLGGGVINFLNLLPRLQNLRLQVDEENRERVLDLLEARSVLAGECLTSVSLHFYADMDPSVLQNCPRLNKLSRHMYIYLESDDVQVRLSGEVDAQWSDEE